MVLTEVSALVMFSAVAFIEIQGARCSHSTFEQPGDAKEIDRSDPPARRRGHRRANRSSPPRLSRPISVRQPPDPAAGILNLSPLVSTEATVAASARRSMPVTGTPCLRPPELSPGRHAATSHYVREPTVASTMVSIRQSLAALDDRTTTPATTGDERNPCVHARASW